MPTADGEVGFGFEVAPGAKIQVGYQAAFAGGILQTNQLCTGEDSSAGCPTKRSDVVIHGPFARIAVSF